MLSWHDNMVNWIIAEKVKEFSTLVLILFVFLLSSIIIKLRHQTENKVLHSLYSLYCCLKMLEKANYCKWEWSVVFHPRTSACFEWNSYRVLWVSTMNRQQPVKWTPQIYPLRIYVAFRPMSSTPWMVVTISVFWVVNISLCSCQQDKL